jgi:hypothetical protein
MSRSPELWEIPQLGKRRRLVRNFFLGFAFPPIERRRRGENRRPNGVLKSCASPRCKLPPRLPDGPYNKNLRPFARRSELPQS